MKSVDDDSSDILYMKSKTQLIVRFPHGGYLVIIMGVLVGIKYDYHLIQSFCRVIQYLMVFPAVPVVPVETFKTDETVETVTVFV